MKLLNLVEGFDSDLGTTIVHTGKHDYTREKKCNSSSELTSTKRNFLLFGCEGFASLFVFVVLVVLFCLQ